LPQDTDGGVISSNATLSLSNANYFSLSSGSVALAAGSEGSVGITFKPGKGKSTTLSATLNISSNGGNATVSLQGKQIK
jgi:hypothetical protein